MHRYISMAIRNRIKSKFCIVFHFLGRSELNENKKKKKKRKILLITVKKTSQAKNWMKRKILYNLYFIE